MIAGYSLSQVKKFVVALVFAAAYVVGFLILPHNGDHLAFAQTAIALVGPVFGVVGVFAAKNHTPDDLQKALEAAKGAALTIVGYFTVVNPSVAQEAELVIGAIVSVVAVWWARNN